MQAFKAKVKTQQVSDEEPMLRFPEISGMGSVRVQAVYYSSKNPSRHLLLYDGDGDLFLFPVPGQETEKVIPLDCPITVKLPLHYIDEDAPDNEVIVFGEIVGM